VDAPVVANGGALWLQVGRVDSTVAEWTACGVSFTHGGRKTCWGYGAELTDPDGYLVRLWDERSMRER
jgi:hypothetical protein